MLSGLTSRINGILLETPIKTNTHTHTLFKGQVTLVLVDKIRCFFTVLPYHNTIYVSAIMFIGVCVWKRLSFVCVAYRKCGFIVSPSTAQTCIIFTLLSVHFFFFFFWRIFTGGKSWPFLLQVHFPFFLLLTLERKEEEEPKQTNNNNNLHRIHRLSGSCFFMLFLAVPRTLARKKERSIILASMLWSQNTNTFILLFVLFSFAHFFLKQVPVVFCILTTCVPVQKKGRFVVVLSSHLRCSPCKEAQILL